MEDAKIPKFGSFRPKSVKKLVDRDDGVTGRSASVKVDDSRHSHRSKNREESKRRHDGDDYTRRIKRQDVKWEAKRASDGDQLDESNLYLIDSRGDHQNIQYGSIHRFNIPPYRRVGHGGIIGRSPLVQIDKNMSTDRSVYLMPGGRHTHKEARRPLMSKHGKPNESKYKFVTTASGAKDDFDDDFVSLQRPSKRMRVATEPEDDQNHSLYPDYRSIEGKAKANPTMDDDTIQVGSGSDLDEERLDLELAAQQENSKLLRQARAAPLNADLWLELTANQAQLVNRSADGATMTTTQRRSLAELRLSVLNEAFKHVLKNHTHRGLLLARSIDEGAFLWDKAKVDSRWKEALLECPNDLQLYQKYLDYVQGDPRTFTFERCKVAFLRGLALIANSNITTQERKTQLDGLKLMTRLIGLVRDSGYSELATATWQVVLEFRFFRPSQLSTVNRSKLLDSLEHFWESDVARIGEEGASGWAGFSETLQGRKRASHSPNSPALDPSCLLGTFAEEESRISSLCYLPASTNDLETEDPFRFVMFKDLDDMIDHLEVTLPEDVVLDAFLSFYGLPRLVTERTNPGVWGDTYDPFLTGHNTRNLQKAVFENDDNLFDHLVQSRRATTFSLFRDGFKSFIGRSKTPQHPDSQLILFLDRCLETLGSALPDSDALAEYILAWKLHMFPETAAKTAKRLLKAKPSSLRLYNAFALIEAAFGRIERARDIWLTALKMCSSLAPDAQLDKILLWHNLVLTHAQHGKEESVLDALLGTISSGVTMPESTESGKRSASQLLRLTQTLRSEFGRTLIDGDIFHSTLNADCLAWLSYLSGSFDITAALASYRQLQNEIVKTVGVNEAETLAQCKAALLRHHLRQKRQFKPADWAEELSDDLSRYPSNSVLLNLHNEMASHDRLRCLMREQRWQDLTKTKVFEWRFIISREVQRLHQDGSGSNVNTIRALFDKALLHPESTAKHSADLWTLWLCIEYQYAKSSPRNGKLDPFQQAKQVFLHGLRYLPWFKPWTLLGMKLFGQEAAYQPELQRVYQTMLERGMRIRTDLDNAW